MRILSVKMNNQNNFKPTLNRKHAAVSKSPAFTGGLSSANQNRAYALLLKKYKHFETLSNTAGEAQNIIIMGLGTAFVAPVFIAHNPLSKQDEKTKKYSAMRQPLSAVISTVTGLGINMPISAAFSKMAAEGRLSTFDMQAKPPSAFLKSRYKSIVKNFAKMSELDKKYFDMVKGSDIKDADAFKLKFPDVDGFKKAVHSVTQKNAAKKLLDPSNINGLRNIDLGTFLVKNLKVKAHPFIEGQLNPDFGKKYLKNTSAVSFLKELGMDVDELKLRTFLGKNFYKERFHEEIKENKKMAEVMFNLIKKNSKEEDFAGLDEKKIEHLFKESLSEKGFNDSQRKVISRLSELWVNEKVKVDEKIPVKTLFKVLGIEENFHEHAFLKVKMDKFLLWINKNLAEGTDPKSFKNMSADKISTILPKEVEANGAKLMEFAGQIATNAVETAERKFGSYGKVQGIILSLAILPFACGALNWSYPRFMEKCFPKLAGVVPQGKAVKTAENKRGV